MTERAIFRAIDVTRAVRGFKRAGERLGRVEIDTTGAIVIIPAERLSDDDEEQNPWDAA